MSVVRRYPRNTRGRDFVVGDLHGAFGLLDEAMCRAGFNPDTDRIFSTGDLVDRGPESARCLEFLSKPYFHAVRGNHEAMLLDMHADGDPHPAVVKYMISHNGSGWWLETPRDVQEQILSAVASLPLAIEIETFGKTVGVIHADVPNGMSWQKFLRLLESGDKETVETCLEGRKRIRAHNHEGVDGIGRLFVGHTPQWGGISRYGNVCAIDTGAIFGHIGARDEGKLSMVSLCCRTKDMDRSPTLDLIDLRIGEG